MLVLYYRDVLKLKPKERKVKLYKFCKDNIPDFNKVLYYKTINRALNKGNDKKQKLITIDKVDVYKNEVCYINSLNIEYSYKKLLFAFLIQMKLNKLMFEKRNKKEYKTIYFKGGRKKYQNIKSMANVSNRININDDFINDMSQGKNSLIKILHNGLISLDFLKDCKQEGNVEIEVKDYENVGWYLDYYNHVDKIVLCEYCGQPFKQKRKDSRFCKKHIQYQPIESKTITCIDCGKKVKVDGIVKNKKRCNECQDKANKELKSKRNQRYYNSHK